jgi:pimeloyl-ACP methyl ester carboxylesterase
MTALWVALHTPHRVRRLILANTAAKIGHLELWTERIRVAQTDGMAPLADASMGRWFTEGYRAR